MSNLRDEINKLGICPRENCFHGNNRCSNKDYRRCLDDVLAIVDKHEAKAPADERPAQKSAISHLMGLVGPEPTTEALRHFFAVQSIVDAIDANTAAIKEFKHA
jgi:hypothetical protein